MDLTKFDFNLPSELIAQYPVDKRDHSRLLIAHKDTLTIEHRFFYDLPEYLTNENLLILNKSRVIPARLYTNEKNGQNQLEFLLVKKTNDHCYEAMVKPGRKAKIGQRFDFSKKNSILTGAIEAILENGNRIINFQSPVEIEKSILALGQIPLPPYIQREVQSIDTHRYQTVFAEYDGSIAAPTAGLHFTSDLIDKLMMNGVGIDYITLHVGPGTFKPVKTKQIEDHVISQEEFFIESDVLQRLRETKKNKNKKITAVGTTATRTLETLAPWILNDNELEQIPHKTDIYIYPPYTFGVVDQLITNFHLPKSSLFILVCAFCGLDFAHQIYQEAIAKRYRFYSYGDAMLIL